MPTPTLRLKFDAAKLLAENPPKLHHKHKVALLEVAYPEGSAPSGEIEVTQWSEIKPASVDLSKPMAIEIVPNFYDYAPSADPSNPLEWHVNFADPHLFVAYGSGLMAQDEMQVAEHPLLGCVREALLAQGHSALTSVGTKATPILVRNVERRIALDTSPNEDEGRPYGLYGNLFARAKFEWIRTATRILNPPTYSHFIAIAAPGFGIGEYTPRQIESIFATAYTGFAAAVAESGARTTAIHTGFWGCGAFGGNRRVMIPLQILAARAAGVSRLILHAGDDTGAEEMNRGVELSQTLALPCGRRASWNRSFIK